MNMQKQLEPIIASCLIREGDEYSFSFCNLLTQSVEGLLHDRKNGQNGIFVQPMYDLMNGNLVGNRITLFSGTHTLGIALPVCPFCGGSLMSKDEKSIWRDLVS